MTQILTFIGFYGTDVTKHKFTYIINTVSIGLLITYLVFYVIFVRSIYVTALSLINFCIFLLVYYLLKHKFYLSSKIMMILGFLIQETALVFLWFPIETHFNYFYFIVAPITFLIFDFNKRNERILTIAFNGIAVICLTLSESLEFVPYIDLSSTLTNVFSVVSVISAISSIAIVYYFYANSLSAMYKELRTLANTDSLTNIANRRVLFSDGEALFNLCKKYHKQMTLILFDIDHFKLINDTYGHPMGDDVLVEMTELISKNIRKNDLFARYGGEEFAIILKDTHADKHLQIANSLKETIDSHVFAQSEKLELHLTVSAGVVAYNRQYDDFDTMVMAADKALYQAKTNGRNQVVVSQ